MDKSICTAPAAAAHFLLHFIYGDSIIISDVTKLNLLLAASSASSTTTITVIIIIIIIITYYNNKLMIILNHIVNANQKQFLNLPTRLLLFIARIIIIIIIIYS